MLDKKKYIVKDGGEACGGFFCVEGYHFFSFYNIE
mgnify:CR=1 FL=1